MTLIDAVYLSWCYVWFFLQFEFWLLQHHHRRRHFDLRFLANKMSYLSICYFNNSIYRHWCNRAHSLQSERLSFAIGQHCARECHHKRCSCCRLTVIQTTVTQGLLKRLLTSVRRKFWFLTEIDLKKRATGSSWVKLILNTVKLMSLQATGHWQSIWCSSALRIHHLLVNSQVNLWKIVTRPYPWKERVTSVLHP